MRLGSLFTGIGAWEKGLKNIGKDYDLKFFSEIDKYAITSRKFNRSNIVSRFI